MKLYLTLLSVIGLALSSCTGQTSQNYATIPALTFAEKLKTIPKAQLIDVRTPEEFASQHIDRAKNVDWMGNDFESKALKLDKSKPIFVYCASGARSKRASEKLQELGFKKIFTLEGGLMKWNAAGLAPKNDKIVGMCSQEYGDLLNSDKKVLVNFYAEWCEPCRKMTPYLKKMQGEMAADVTIIRLNADENKTLISELKIEELPTLILYRNKEVTWKRSGFISEEDLKKQLQ